MFQQSLVDFEITNTHLVIHRVWKISGFMSSQRFKAVCIVSICIVILDVYLLVSFCISSNVFSVLLQTTWTVEGEPLYQFWAKPARSYTSNGWELLWAGSADIQVTISACSDGPSTPKPQNQEYVHLETLLNLFLVRSYPKALVVLPGFMCLATKLSLWVKF